MFAVEADHDIAPEIRSYDLLLVDTSPARKARRDGLYVFTIEGDPYREAGSGHDSTEQ
jgi:hypothetical protein